jgi:manganese-dependent inorganic pyrophosphatase
MARERHPLIVVGHKNPDTDSICSAIAYARFKTAVVEEEAQAFRAGNINPQTRFVLARFETESPPLLADLYPRLSDIMIPRPGLLTVSPWDEVSRAAEILTTRGFSFLPVVDGEDRCVGVLTVLRVAGILKDLAALPAGKDLGAAAHRALSAKVREYVEVPHPTFRPGDLARAVIRDVAGRNAGGFLVLDDDGRLVGVITRENFLAENRFRVVMVDHNELSQAVDGMDQADVVEILDHHRLANRPTSVPVTFINKTVGSTATLVAEQYRNAGALPPPRDAGLLLSALLSDTVILKSPTATPLDAKLAEWLAGIARVEIQPYGEEMFSAGSELEGYDAKAIIGRDQKTYQEGDWKFSVSQIETVGFGLLLSKRSELIEELEAMVRRDSLTFACLMATDVTRETSLFLIKGDGRVIGSITYPRREEGIFEMKDVLSRKKQVLPYLLEILKKL